MKVIITMMKKKVVIAAVLVALVSLSFLGYAIESRMADITSTNIPDPLPLTDPDSQLWLKATEFDVPLGSQTIIAPVKPAPSVPSIKVRSLNNGTHIAFLISWSDATKNDRAVKIDEFRDAGAVLLGPVGEEAVLAMGTASQPVNVLHWKADWQSDIEKGFQDLQSAFPNFWVDVYPNAIGNPPYNVPTAFSDEAKLYLPGWKVGNLLSQPLKVTPVEETRARGFGSITSEQSQDAIGRGVWENGQWRIVIARQLNPSDTEDIKLAPNVKYSTAFAIWDGASDDVGARKSISALLTLYIQ